VNFISREKITSFLLNDYSICGEHPRAQAFRFLTMQPAIGPHLFYAMASLQIGVFAKLEENRNL